MKNNKYPLRILFWESTLRCNAYCEFCGSRCGDNDCSNELSKEEICRVFKQIAERYDPSQIMINVSGGEPLMRKDLIPIMQYAVSLGYQWGLVTNGMLLTEEMINALKQTDLKTVSISIDGLQETHDSLRGVKGGLDSVLQNIKLFSEAEFLETIMITTVVSKKNITELDNIKKLLKSLHINSWRICPVDPIGRANGESELLLSNEQINYLYDYIVSCRNESLPFSVTTSCSHYLGKYEFDVRSFPFQCNAGKTVGSILANGDIFVCSNVPRVPELIQGNIRNDNFVDVWEKGFSYFRNTENRRQGKCAECVYYTNCCGDSLHTWDFENHNPHFCMKDYGFEPIILSEGISVHSFNSVLQRIKGNKEKISDACVAAQSLSKDIVIITPDALNSIFDYFCWGSKEKTVEKICALMGNIYRNADIKEEAFIICVEAVINIDAPEATDKTLMINPHFEVQVSQVTSYLSNDYAHIGFIHSHPNELNIAMSLGDFQWHRHLYENNWRQALSIILNPQKKHIAAYAGPVANHIELHLLGYNEYKKNTIHNLRREAKQPDF